MTAKELHEVMTLAEAAEFLRISERTLWGRVKAGEVPHARIGAQYRFVRRQLAEWLEKQIDVAASQHRKR